MFSRVFRKGKEQSQTNAVATLDKLNEVRFRLDSVLFFFLFHILNLNFVLTFSSDCLWMTVGVRLDFFFFFVWTSLDLPSVWFPEKLKEKERKLEFELCV